MNRSLDVVCVGSATLDLIGVVDRMPAADERVLSEPFVSAGGGPAATAAVALARLGARVAFCGVVGDDAAGELVREGFAREGVDTRYLTVRPGAPTSRSVVLVERDTAARTIVASPSPVIEAAMIPLDASLWLHVDQHGYAPTAAALRSAAAGPEPLPALSIDAGNPIAGLELDGVGLYVPTADALLARFGESGGIDAALAAAARDGAERVVATAGSAGAHVWSDGAHVHVPGESAEVVSTLGAGDVFHGAILAGLLDGKDLADAAAFACLVAALSCRGLDGRSRIPTRSEVQSLLERRLPRASATPTAPHHG